MKKKYKPLKSFKKMEKIFLCSDSDGIPVYVYYFKKALKHCENWKIKQNCSPFMFSNIFLQFKNFMLILFMAFSFLFIQSFLLRI